MYSPVRKEKQVNNQEPPRKTFKSRINDPEVEKIKKKISFDNSDQPLPINAKNFR